MADALHNTSPAREITLTVGGLVYGGWTAARVTVGMDRVAGEFALDVTELWADAVGSRHIRPGEECELKVAEQTIITGYVDSVDVQIDAGQHTVSIRGRDRSADLIDCSAVRSPGQWRKQKLESIARQLAEPFGVAVRADVDTGKPMDFALQTGETVYEAIDHAARQRGLLVMSDGVGGLVLTRAGLARAADPLVYGENVLALRSSFDVRDRYSEYTALGQAPGNDLFNGKAASQIKARAADKQILRYRPLLITGGSSDAAGSLIDRVQWEATVRAARSMSVEIAVQGFTQSDGSLWRPNTLVHVMADPLLLREDLLIASVSFEISERGSMTTIAATRADAYTLAPLEVAAAGTARPYFDLVGPRQ